jgi:hypothetical protein
MRSHSIVLHLSARNSVRTSQETHYVSATMPNRLMLFREPVAVYCDNHTEHPNTVRTSKEIMFLGSKVRLVRKADNLTTIYEPIVYTMWDP